MLADTKVEECLDALWENEPWRLLGDAAYPANRRIIRPDKKSEAAYSELRNRALGSIRVPVEWAFGASGYGVASRFEGVLHAKLMRLQQRPVADYMMTAVLLSNMLVCDEQTSPVAAYFCNKLRIPTLTEYMAFD